MAVQSGRAARNPGVQARQPVSWPRRAAREPRASETGWTTRELLIEGRCGTADNAVGIQYVTPVNPRIPHAPATPREHWQCACKRPPVLNTADGRRREPSAVRN
jgi:hypothetical protein